MMLGPWETALAMEQRQGGDTCAGWLAELDRPLDASLLAAGLDQVRDALPTYFARVAIAEAGQLALAVEPARPGTAIVREVPEARSIGGSIRVLANEPLDPFSDGLTRCFFGGGSVPQIGFQWAHVAGDGFSHERFRAVFSGAVDAAERGGSVTPGLTRTTEPLTVQDLRQILPINAQAASALGLPPGRLRIPVLRSAATSGCSAATRRVFQASIDRALYATVISRCARLNVSPLALLAAAFVLAVDEAAAPWAEEAGDFFGLAVPHDVRGRLERTGEIGNLSLPQGLPFYRNDPLNVEALAVALFNRLECGRFNRLFYRHFLASHYRPQATNPAMTCDAAGLTLQPFGSFGVTELQSRSELTSIGCARIVQTIFSTPLLTRRYTNGSTRLSCTIRWHPAFDGVLRSIFAGMLSRLVGGSDVEWQLL